MSTPYPTPDIARCTRVSDVNDDALRRGHPLLDARRVASFSHWLDDQLATLELRFQDNITPRTLRKSLGR